ncbi:hypothetical protein LINPERPRIM_LOCUS2129 [Linum perenne]
MDSTCVVRLLTVEDYWEHQHVAIVSKFRLLTERDWRVSMKHVHMEANHLADRLANKGHTMGYGRIRSGDKIMDYVL